MPIGNNITVILGTTIITELQAVLFLLKRKYNFITYNYYFVVWGVINDRCIEQYKDIFAKRRSANFQLTDAYLANEPWTDICPAYDY